MVVSRNRLVVLWLWSILLFILFPCPVIAEEERLSEKQAMAASLMEITLADLPPIQQDVIAEDGTLLAPAGTVPEDFLNPFDMDWENKTISQIEIESGEPVTRLPISAFPGLSQYLNREAKKKQFNALLKPWDFLIQPAIAQVAPPPNSVVPVNSIPGLGNVTIQTLTGPLGNPNPVGANVTTTVSGIPSISSIPGLGSIPMLNAILSLKDYFIPMDVVYAGGKYFDAPCKMGGECKEQPIIPDPASGTWRNQFIPCKPGEAKGDNCGHLEVLRRGGMAARSRNFRWMSKLHKVKAGNWLCFKEPTGRYPFGRNPKLVVEDLKENGGKGRKAQAEFALYFSIKGPFGLRSAACFGPVPLPIFGNRKEGDLIIFGLDRPSTTSPLAGLIAGVPNPGQAPAQGGGGQQNLPVPVDCQGTQSSYIRPSNGVVTRGFGYLQHPILGGVRFHDGIDISGGFGTPILASNCGVVVSAGWNGGYGNDICVKHSPTITTCSSHLQAMLVKTGDTVKKGQVIGEEGTTGQSTGPHLHFTVLENGKPVDPRSHVPI